MSINIIIIQCRPLYFLQVVLKSGCNRTWVQKNPGHRGVHVKNVTGTYNTIIMIIIITDLVSFVLVPLFTLLHMLYRRETLTMYIGENHFISQQFSSATRISSTNFVWEAVTNWHEAVISCQREFNIQAATVGLSPLHDFFPSYLYFQRPCHFWACFVVHFKFTFYCR